MTQRAERRVHISRKYMFSLKARTLVVAKKCELPGDKEMNGVVQKNKIVEIRFLSTDGTNAIQKGLRLRLGHGRSRVRLQLLTQHYRIVISPNPPEPLPLN